MKKTVSNNSLTIQVSPHGAELSIVANATGKRIFMAGRSYLLETPFAGTFPIVGSLWNNEYRHNGKTLQAITTRFCTGSGI